MCSICSWRILCDKSAIACHVNNKHRTTMKEYKELLDRREKGLEAEAEAALPVSEEVRRDLIKADVPAMWPPADRVR